MNCVYIKYIGKVYLISYGFDDLVLQYVMVKQFPWKYVVNALDL